MQEFASNANIPPYAILSHTWCDDEVSFSDWEKIDCPEIQRKEGFQKILYCCEQARRDELEWVWIDT